MIRTTMGWGGGVVLYLGPSVLLLRVSLARLCCPRAILIHPQQVC